MSVKLFLSNHTQWMRFLTETAQREIESRNEEECVAALGAAIDWGKHREIGKKFSARGIHFGHQYARLTWETLREILPNREELAKATRQLAQYHGLLPDMRVPEDVMRVVLHRPTNLFAVEGMEEFLAAKVNDAIVPKLTEAEIGTLDDVRYTQRLAPSSYAINNLIENWHAIFNPKSEGEVDQADSESWLKLSTRIHEILAERGLWTNVVWTNAERARRIQLGWDLAHEMDRRIAEVQKRNGPHQGTEVT
ncbi:MAG: hypothetical protein NUV56_02200 [Candidatus Uhrbacteria bacterium]|nr:hypothetical protein [Candidatus Uhrbacteria bacterium]